MNAKLLYRLAWCAFLALALTNLLLYNHAAMFWDEDETAYAGFARTMLHTGNWTIPNFMWCDIHRKTPLHFWAIALCFRLFGETEFAARLPSVLAYVAMLASLYVMGARIWGRERVAWAVVVLTSSLLVPNVAKIGVTDSGLLLNETWVVLAIANLLRADLKVRARWFYVGLFWAAVAFGLLLKGPPVLVVAGGMCALLVFVHPRGWQLWKLYPVVGLPLAMLPLFAWGYMAWQADGGKFITWLWDWYVWKRVSGEKNVVTDTWKGPAGYHFAIFIGSFLVWLPLLFSSLTEWLRRTVRYARDYVRVWRVVGASGFWWKGSTDAALAAKAGLDGETVFFFAWLVWAWVFYEISPSKLPAYSIAAQPALALLIAARGLRLRTTVATSGERTWGVILCIVLLIVSSALGFFGIRFFGGEGGSTVAPLAFSLWVGGLATAVALFGAGRYVLPIAALNGLLFSFWAWAMVVPMIEHKRDSTRRAAQAAAALNHDANGRKIETLVFCVEPGTALPSLVYYAQPHFDTLRTLGSTAESDYYYYRKSTVFLTDSASMVRLKPFLIRDSIPYTIIPIWIIDRQRTDSYMIFRSAPKPATNNQ